MWVPTCSKSTPHDLPGALQPCQGLTLSPTGCWVSKEDPFGHILNDLLDLLILEGEDERVEERSYPAVTRATTLLRCVEWPLPGLT